MYTKLSPFLFLQSFFFSVFCFPIYANGGFIDSSLDLVFEFLSNWALGRY